MTSFGGGLTPAQFYNGLNSFNKIYNVKDSAYGAVGNGVADDTTAIQSAINACVSGGGGIVYFPNGIYIIGGALQNDVEGVDYNSQLYIPQVNYSSASKICIKLLGESEPNMTLQAPWNTMKAHNTGVILRSTIESIADDSYVIASKGAITNYLEFNYNQCDIENIQIRLKVGSSGKITMGGIGFKKAGNAIIKNTNVFPYDTTFSGINEPTVKCTGIALPQYNSDVQNILINCACGGVTSGFYLGDHFSANKIYSCGCVNAFEIGHFNMMGVGGHLESFGCKNAVTLKEGVSRFVITNLHSEWTDAGYWSSSEKIINDVNNYGFGSVGYDIVYGEELENNRLSNIGGTNIRCYPTIPATSNYTISGARDESEGALKDFITKVSAILGLTDSTTAS